MHDDIHPISPPPGTVPEGLAPYQPPRRRRVRLAVAALALVAGGTAAGATVGTLGSGEHGPGFGTVTSSAFAGGQEEPNEPEQPAPAATTHHSGDGGDTGGEND